MNLERHEGHAVPRVFFADADPMFVAFCAPHDEAGPWGEPEIFKPFTNAERRAAVDAANLLASSQSNGQPAADAPAAHASDEAQQDGWIVGPQEWAVDARSKLAAAALRAVTERLHEVRLDIEIVATAEQRRPALAAYPNSDDLWFVVDDDERAVVATRSLDVVEFVTGLRITRELSPFVTVAVRADDFAAALYFDWDDERFYVAEAGDTVLQAALNLARRTGCEVVEADDGVWMMAGLDRTFFALKSWALDRNGKLRSRYRSRIATILQSSAEIAVAALL